MLGELDKRCKAYLKARYHKTNGLSFYRTPGVTAATLYVATVDPWLHSTTYIDSNLINECYVSQPS